MRACISSSIIAAFMIFSSVAYGRKSNSNKGLSKSLTVAMQRLVALNELMLDYKIHHGYESVAASVKTKSFCQRKFIFSKLSCFEIGNNYGRFLNALAMAIILNRTFVSQFDSRDCENGLIMKSWITNDEKFNALSVEAGCLNQSSPPILYRTKKGSNIPMKCCPFTSVNISKLIFASITNEAFNLFNAFSGGLLPIDAQERANILFGNDTFGTGKYDSFGFLQFFSVSFGDPIINSIESSLQQIYIGGENSSFISSNWGFRPLTYSQFYQFPSMDTIQVPSYLPNHVFIGMHVRHQSNDPLKEANITKTGEQCLLKVKSLLAQQPIQRNCTVLLATDRQNAMDRLIRFITNEMQCNVQYALRPPAIHPEVERLIGQRGPWSQGMVALADLLLLSQAQYFIGTRLSTFSLLMAYNIVAHNTLRRDIYGAKTANATIISSANALHEQLLWIHGGVGCELDDAPKQSPMDCLNIRTSDKKLPYYDYENLVCTH